MTKNFTYKGIWWLPTNKEKVLSGALTFKSNEQIKLELMGAFSEPEGLTSFIFHEYKLILGTTADGEKITLYRCKEININRSHLNTSEYTAVFILVGAHFESEEELLFNSINGQIDNLEQWVNINGFKKINTDLELHKIHIEYELPKSVEFTVNPQLHGAINFIYSVPSSLGKVKIKQKAELRLKLAQPQNFDNIWSTFYHFQIFLTLASWESSQPRKLHLTNEHNGKIQKIDLYFINRVTKYNKSNKRSTIFLFNYRDIFDNFDAIIKKWYSNIEKNKPSLYLLVECFHASNKFDENYFLNISQAIETFHRRFRNNNVLSKVEHEKRINEILDSVAPEHKDWLKERLVFSNEPNLHTRLEKLITDLNNNTVKKIIGEPTDFIKLVKKNRNYYTHYDKKLENKALKGAKLYYLTERLKVLLVCVILKESGFTDIQIESFFEKGAWTLFNHIM